jgi:maleate cis-trans isomerase
MNAELGDAPAARTTLQGWRARIGLLIPQLDYLTEALLPHYLPSGVSFHTSRLRRVGPINLDTLGGMNATVSAAADLLPLPFLNALVYHCTMGSFLYEPAQLVADLERQTGLATIATAKAALDVFEAIGAQRLCLVTPYSSALNEYEVQFLRNHGLDPVTIGGANIDDSGEMQRVTSEEIALWVRGAMRGPVDAIFISCTGIRSHPVIDLIEADYGCPVITSLNAMLWSLCRKLNLPTKISGLGSLLR